MEFKTITTLWRMLPELHGRVYRLGGFIIFYEILKLAPAAVLAIVIDTLIGFDPSQLPFVIALITALFIASMLVSWLDINIAYESAMIDYSAEASLLRQVAEKLLRLPIGYHEGHNTGRTVHTLHRGVDRLGELIFFAGKELAPTTVQLLLTSGILLWIGIVPGLVFLSFIPVFFYLIHRYGKKVQPLRQEYHEQMEIAAGHIGERVMNIRTVQDYAVEKRELRVYDVILGDFIRLGKKRMDYHKVFFLIRDTFTNLARVAIMGVGVWLVWSGDMTPGILVLFITLSEKANLSLFRLTNVYDRAADSAEGIRRLLQLFSEEEAIIEKPDAKPVAKVEGHIEFKDVTFAYGNGKPVLTDVSFTVPTKSMLAVLGRSGAGKSTIVKLLYRHYDVTQGSINVGGTNIRDYKLRQYRRQFALVPQDIEIFNSTVSENIAFGNPDAPQAEIERVAKVAYAHDFIKDFPQGYETLVGERGVRLSGGQRQRIGIARALLANPSILVFDEATSSLDTESEQLIQKAMREIAKDFTMIVIAHRLSTVEHADAVMILQDGKIAEMGTHEDLVAQKGIYTKMRELQRLGEVRE